MMTSLKVSLSIAPATVSIACKIGTPEVSRVESVREKRATAMLWLSLPKTGIFIL